MARHKNRKNESSQNQSFENRRSGGSRFEENVSDREMELEIRPRGSGRIAEGNIQQRQGGRQNQSQGQGGQGRSRGHNQEQSRPGFRNRNEESEYREAGYRQRGFGEEESGERNRGNYCPECGQSVRDIERGADRGWKSTGEWRGQEEDRDIRQSPNRGRSQRPNRPMYHNEEYRER
jgi:hypothetical protein